LAIDGKAEATVPKRILAAVLAMAAMMVPASGHAKIIDLAPATPWNAQFEPESCRLSRSFGPESERVTLIYEFFSPQANGSLTLIGKRLYNSALYGEARIWFGDARPLQSSPVLNATTGGVPTWISNLVPLTAGQQTAANAQPDPSAEATIDRLTLDSPFTGTVVLHTGAMDQPMKIVRTCFDAMVTAWGLDPAVQRNLSHQPEPITRPGTWVNDNDYPRKALDSGSSGLLRFRLMVDASGNPTACIIQKKTKPDDFMPIACRLLMSRARFKPAIDATGKPVTSYFANTIRFQFGRP
jgi:hypothetical protein